MARQPDASKQQRWLDHMRRWQQSPCSVRAFCARYGLTQASFYFWRRVLHRRGLLPESPARTRATPPTSQSTAFVKLTLADEAPRTTAVEVVLNERRRLRVSPGFDPATVLQLVRLLEEPAC
jgi:transposase-like protein